MTKVDVKPLTNIDLLALIRTISLELENRECAVTKYVEREIPSTFEEVEHDGKLLWKVDREAQVGDYIRLFDTICNSQLKDGVIYGPTFAFGQGLELYTHEHKKYGYSVYATDHNRTIETVEVFEVVAHEVDKPAPLTVNQQRAELIQRAREFVEGLKHKDLDGYIIESKNDGQFMCDAKFVHDLAKRTSTCTLIGFSSRYTRKKAVAHCHPNEVFNEPLGEVVSLCMALQIDIPQEFIDAVQPDEKVLGHIVKWDEATLTQPGYTSRISPPGQYKRGKGRCAIDSDFGRNSTIIDDSNAEYEFVSVDE